MASAIDLAGSEDNRRTENQKERMVESASINKSLFTLAKCVEAISRPDVRIPFRESKMTRILNIGMFSFRANPFILQPYLELQDIFRENKILGILSSSLDVRIFAFKKEC